METCEDVATRKPRTPCTWARCRTAARPDASSAPATSTVPSGSQIAPVAAGPEDGARTSRGVRTRPPRTAACGSSPRASSSAAKRPACASPASSPTGSATSRSRTATRPGCSACTERISPQTAAPARSSGCPSPGTATAPRVSTTSLPVSARRPSQPRMSFSTRHTAVLTSPSPFSSTSPPTHTTGSAPAGSPRSEPTAGCGPSPNGSSPTSTGDAGRAAAGAAGGAGAGVHSTVCRMFSRSASSREGVPASRWRRTLPEAVRGITARVRSSVGTL
ncbi:Uncharacterised protein [Mycobacterium tuberculosis]|nr:Uncharacterised protein [Mycobacterium tuberculosis]